MEKFVITVIGKTILKSAVRIIEKLHETEQTKTESPSADEYKFFLDTVNLHKNPENLVNISQIKNEPYSLNITLFSNGTPTSYKIDFGTQCNVIPVDSLENISPKRDLQPENVKLSAYNSSKMPVVGKCSLTLAHKSNLLKISFIVADSDSVTILRLKTSKHLQLIKEFVELKELVKRFSQYFMIVSEK